MPGSTRCWRDCWIPSRFPRREPATVRVTASVRAVICAVLVLASGVEPGAAQGPAPGTKRFDTGYGFSIDLPAGLERGPQAGNARLVFASSTEDFTVVVANFGPKQEDTAAAGRVYRESFNKSGMTIETESDVVVSAVPARRFVMKFDSPSGAGHAEAVLFPVGDEVFGVIAIVPIAGLEARRQMLGRVMDSIRLGK